MSEMTHSKTQQFQRNVAKLCEGYGRSSQIAEAAGIRREHLYKIATGQTVPGLDIALQISEAVEIPLADLLEKEVIPEKV